MIVIWLDTAVEDINAICNFLAVKSPFAAGDLYDRFLDRAEDLLVFSEAGPIEPVLEDCP